MISSFKRDKYGLKTDNDHPALLKKNPRHKNGPLRYFTKKNCLNPDIKRLRASQRKCQYLKKQQRFY